MLCKMFSLVLGTCSSNKMSFLPFVCPTANIYNKHTVNKDKHSQSDFSVFVVRSPSFGVLRTTGQPCFLDKGKTNILLISKQCSLFFVCQSIGKFTNHYTVNQRIHSQQVTVIVQGDMAPCVWCEQKTTL